MDLILQSRFCVQSCSSFINNKIYIFTITCNLKSNGLLKLCEKGIQLLNSRFTHDILFTGVKVICFTFIVSSKSATMRMELITHLCAFKKHHKISIILYVGDRIISSLYLYIYFNFLIILFEVSHSRSCCIFHMRG